MTEPADQTNKAAWTLSDDEWLIWGPEGDEHWLGPNTVAAALGFANETTPEAGDAYDALVEAVESTTEVAEARELALQVAELVAAFQLTGGAPTLERLIAKTSQMVSVLVPERHQDPDQ